ncbi:MAG: aldehyde ferredoxin oxidoreductase family protein, partial [Candidatus Hodarchaeota archaeon]
MNGYNNKIAYIDLSSSSVNVKDLDPSIADAYIGGVGLSAKITHDLLSDDDYEVLKNDPFSSINPLIFATGPLTNTATPSSARYSVTGISPLTGFWGEATSGGFLPNALKRSGFDALVITGESEKPSCIAIDKGEIEIKDGGDLWGLNSRETIKKVQKNLESEAFRVACIGKAGENLVKYAGIMNDEGRAAGRCGLGAIMGKKKLKVLAVKGGNKIEFANREDLINTSKQALDVVKSQLVLNFYSHYGTLFYTDLGMVFGDVPHKYFTSTEFLAERLTGKALVEQLPGYKYACAGCKTGCGRVTITEIDGEEVEVDGPEYETVIALGPLCDVLNFKPIIKGNHKCNLAGVDTISVGVSIAFLIYLVENKIAIENISNLLDDISIDDIKWGNEDLVLKLLDKITTREGIGDLLAEGVKAMASKLGVDPNLAAHVKGLEFAMHEPRAFHGQALSYATSCVGANHNKGEFFQIDREGGPSYMKIKKGDRFNINGREDSVARMQDINNIYDSAVICSIPHYKIALIAKLFKGATGSAILGNKRKLYTIGERASNLKRLISCKLGCSREDDKLPAIMTKTLSSGGTAGVDLDIGQNLKAYYEHRGWDWETGWPT